MYPPTPSSATPPPGPKEGEGERDGSQTRPLWPEVGNTLMSQWAPCVRGLRDEKEREREREREKERERAKLYPVELRVGGRGHNEGE